MTRGLRKKHLLIWTLLAVLFPAGIISAYIVVPKKAEDNLVQQDKTIALPIEIKKIERNNFTAFLFLLEIFFPIRWHRSNPFLPLQFHMVCLQDHTQYFPKVYPYQQKK